MTDHELIARQAKQIIQHQEEIEKLIGIIDKNHKQIDELQEGIKTLKGYFSDIGSVVDYDGHPANLAGVVRSKIK
jgi:hypothetical protein